MYELICHDRLELFCGRPAPLGSYSAAAIGLPKELVTAERVGEIDWLAETGSAKDTANQLVCFRVYLRRYLAAGRHKTGADGLAEFSDYCAETGRSLGGRAVLPLAAAGAGLDFVAADMGEGSIICRRMRFATLLELLVSDFLLALEQGLPPRLCPVCGRCFAPQRSNETYCSGQTAGGAFCRDVGARLSHAARLSSDERMKLCASARGKVYTRKSRGRLTSKQAAELLEEITRLGEQAAEGEISVDRLREMIKQL